MGKNQDTLRRRGILTLSQKWPKLTLLCVHTQSINIPPSASQMHSTQVDHFHLPVRQKSMYSVIIAKRRHLISVWYRLREPGGTWRLSESSPPSACEERLRERRGLPICPVSPQKGDIVTFSRASTQEITSASLSLSPSVSPLSSVIHLSSFSPTTAPPPPHHWRQKSRSCLLWEIQSRMIIRYSYRKTQGIRTTIILIALWITKMLVLIMTTLLMISLSFVFFSFFFGIIFHYCVSTCSCFLLPRPVAAGRLFLAQPTSQKDWILFFFWFSVEYFTPCSYIYFLLVRKTGSRRHV